MVYLERHDAAKVRSAHGNGGTASWTGSVVFVAECIARRWSLLLPMGAKPKTKKEAQLC